MDDFDPAVGPPARELGSLPPAPPADLVDGDVSVEPDIAEVIPTVDEGTVRSILAGLGNVASVVDRAAPGLWRFTDAELDGLVPPICRLANRNPTLRRALLHGDLVVIAMGMSSYAVRNVTARKEATDDNRPRESQSLPQAPRGAAPFGIVDGGQPAAAHARGGVADAGTGPR